MKAQLGNFREVKLTALIYMNELSSIRLTCECAGAAPGVEILAVRLLVSSEHGGGGGGGGGAAGDVD